MSQHFPDIFSDGYSISSGQTETETETDPASRPPVKVSDLQLGQGGQTGAGRVSIKYRTTRPQDVTTRVSANIFDFYFHQNQQILKIFPCKYCLFFVLTNGPVQVFYV